MVKERGQHTFNVREVSGKHNRRGGRGGEPGKRGLSPVKAFLLILCKGGGTRGGTRE